MCVCVCVSVLRVKQFWEDYNAEHARLVGIWGQREHAGVPVAFLPVAPRSLHVASIKYAHRRVAQRANREHELPDDFDTVEFVHEQDVLEMDD